MKRPNYKLYIMRKFEKLQSIKLKHNNVFDRIEIDYKLNRGGGGNEEDDEIGVVWYKKNGEERCLKWAGGSYIISSSGGEIG